MATPFISPLESLAQDKKLKNWSGNLAFSTNKIFHPTSVEAVQKLVRKYDRFKALGTRHCFNRIADSKHNLISLTELNKVVSVDAKANTVTVEGGIKYGVLAPYLDEKGFALHNLASLPHISVAGSITTATHGSGVGNGNLATAVTALEMVTPNSEVVHLSKDKDGENFLAAVVGLGALGLITKVTLHVEPTYQVRQNVYVQLPLAQLKENFDKIVSAGYSVSLFTDWQTENINEVWIKRRDQGLDMNLPEEFFGAKAATKNLHPIVELSAVNCTEQMGVSGKWYERLPHFKMGFTPSSGVELQSEYFIPQRNAVDAIMAIQRLGKQIGPHLFISEVRTIAADNFWMSPCRNQASVAIHFTWKQEWEAVRKLLPLIEQELEPYKVRPHWGKLFTMSPQTLSSRYEKLEDFKKMIALYDPKGKMRNEFLNTNIFGT
ncbi:FAD-binding protein [Segetibacter sp.]|uniref:FAD-binding protein n=1 Tax=Segetibacter sp. TaxID=2231182 RepID=UPI00262FACE3|nr:FAD-binding protein [Segetibacter sp.]MCW3080122.1 FAD-binding protein [Segetibacter sp.]